MTSKRTTTTKSKTVQAVSLRAPVRAVGGMSIAHYCSVRGIGGWPIGLFSRDDRRTIHQGGVALKNLKSRPVT